MSADKKLAGALKQLTRRTERGDDTGQPSRTLRDFESSNADPTLKSAISLACQALQAPPTQRARMPAEEVVAILHAHKRNPSRFPGEFLFQLAPEEVARLRSRTVISKPGRGGRR
jgi:hypothetical protein